MSVLELEGVNKSYGHHGARPTLREVSLQVNTGEMVVVWGKRRSGRSTLLRVAAGVEIPDGGSVRFDGQDLCARLDRCLPDGLGFCHKTFRATEGRLVLDHLIVGQVARGIPLSVAAQRGSAALERVGIGRCAALRASELDSQETTRLAIARALTFSPRLLLIDEPTIGVDEDARDELLALLQSLAKEGIAVLATTGESPNLSGARALMLSDGDLRGPNPRDLAPVVPLRRSA